MNEWHANEGEEEKCNKSLALSSQEKKEEEKKSSKTQDPQQKEEGYFWPLVPSFLVFQLL
jgi:hypothetical protein